MLAFSGKLTPRGLSSFDVQGPVARTTFLARYCPFVVVTVTRGWPGVMLVTGSPSRNTPPNCLNTLCNQKRWLSDMKSIASRYRAPHNHRKDDFFLNCMVSVIKSVKKNKNVWVDVFCSCCSLTQTYISSYTVKQWLTWKAARALSARRIPPLVSRRPA